MSDVAQLPRGPLMADLSGLSLSNEEREFLIQPAVGAVILFDRNFESREQVSALISQIKSLRSPELLVAVDQEGGRVQRFRQGFFELPPLFAIGQLYDSQPEQATRLSFDAGCLMAAELRQVGVDFSFAPVLDLADLHSQVIGDRGFHNDPLIIAELGYHYVNGMNSAGMQATGKHFPGHGGVLTDSHLQLPVDYRDLDMLMSCDLVPYRNLAPLLGAVMTAHVQYSAIQEELPTYSRFWLKKVLRDHLGFEGLIFSDDLTMKGAEGGVNHAERAERALRAGCDIVLICNEPEAARQTSEHIGRLFAPAPGRLDAMVGGACDVAPEELETLMSSLLPLVEDGKAV